MRSALMAYHQNKMKTEDGDESETKTSEVLVKHSDFEQALKTITPSVSPKQQQHYKDLAAKVKTGL